MVSMSRLKAVRQWKVLPITPAEVRAAEEQIRLEIDIGIRLPDPPPERPKLVYIAPTPPLPPAIEPTPELLKALEASRLKRFADRSVTRVAIGYHTPAENREKGWPKPE